MSEGVLGRVRDRVGGALDRAKRAWTAARNDSYWSFYVDKQEIDERTDPMDHPPSASEHEWLQHQQWQVAYLKEQGLSPTDWLLDLGCGSLRGGTRLVEFLEPRRYVGLDIAETPVRAGLEASRERLRDRKGAVAVVQPNQAWFGGWFDVVWAQSVLTHVPPEHVAEFFEPVAYGLAEEGRALVTFHEADDDQTGAARDREGTSFFYSLDWLADRLPEDLAISHVDRDSGHPSGHEILHLELASSTRRVDAVERVQSHDSSAEPTVRARPTARTGQ